jgi:hypothetical protein
METINLNNLEEILNKIIYNSFMNLNNYMGSDTVYNYIKQISEHVDIYIDEFLDYIYSELLTNYILEIDNITLFNDNVLNKVLEISKIILEK